MNTRKLKILHYQDCVGVVRSDLIDSGVTQKKTHQLSPYLDQDVAKY